VGTPPLILHHRSLFHSRVEKNITHVARKESKYDRLVACPLLRLPKASIQELTN
jgi:hypothetical protein